MNHRDTETQRHKGERRTGDGPAVYLQSDGNFFQEQMVPFAIPSPCLCASVVQLLFLGLIMLATWTALAAEVAEQAARFSKDHSPRVTFLIAEDEYDAKHTLPAFADRELRQPFGFNCVFLQSDAPDDLPGLEKLADADLAVVYMRRRTLPPKQLAFIRAYIDVGKPIVGLRTASHSFQNWLAFDPQVLGGHYVGHHNNKGPQSPTSFVRVIPEMASHPILAGYPTHEFRVTDWLYKVSPLVPTATPLIMGRVGDRQPHEPVAWINTNRSARVFYTSLGHPDDFQTESFRKLLRNGIFWALNYSVPQDPAGK